MYFLTKTLGVADGVCLLAVSLRRVHRRPKYTQLSVHIHSGAFQLSMPCKSCARKHFIKARGKATDEFVKV